MFWRFEIKIVKKNPKNYEADIASHCIVLSTKTGTETGSDCPEY